LQGKLISKVFGKGSGEEPFLRKVCPSKLPVKLLYERHTYGFGFFNSAIIGASGKKKEIFILHFDLLCNIMIIALRK